MTDWDGRSATAEEARKATWLVFIFVLAMAFARQFQ